MRWASQDSGKTLMLMAYTSGGLLTSLGKISLDDNAPDNCIRPRAG